MSVSCSDTPMHLSTFGLPSQSTNPRSASYWHQGDSLKNYGQGHSLNFKRRYSGSCGTAQLWASRSQLPSLQSMLYVTFSQEETEIVYSLVLAMHLAIYIVVSLYITFLSSALLFPQCLSTLTERLLSCSLMVRCYGHKRGHSRVTLWPCLYMHLSLFLWLIRPPHLFSIIV